MANKTNTFDVDLENFKLEQLRTHLEYAFEKEINLKERVILLKGPVDEKMYSLVELGLTELESYNRMPITIRIFSEGGDEYSAMAIVGRIRASKCKIITEGYGQIMSAATLILASGKHRRLSRYSVFMHHEGAYEAGDRHSSVKAEVAHMEWMEEQWSTWLAEMSKKPKAFFLKNGRHIDVYWSPSEVLEIGLVDEIF